MAFNTFSTTEWVYGSPKLERFNGVSSVNIQGSAAEGISSGEAMAEMQKLVSSYRQASQLNGQAYLMRSRKQARKRLCFTHFQS